MYEELIRARFDTCSDCDPALIPFPNWYNTLVDKYNSISEVWGIWRINEICRRLLADALREKKLLCEIWTERNETQREPI